MKDLMMAFQVELEKTTAVLAKIHHMNNTKLSAFFIYQLSMGSNCVPFDSFVYCIPTVAKHQKHHIDKVSDNELWSKQLQAFLQYLG